MTKAIRFARGLRGKIVAEYLANPQRVDALAAKFRVSKSTVYRALRSHGISTETYTKQVMPKRSAHMGDCMRRKWADPEWRERQVQKIAEAAARQRIPTRAIGSRLTKGPRGVNKMGAKIAMPEDMFAAVRALAVKERTSFAEIVRRFVDWGLEEEGVTLD